MGTKLDGNMLRTLNLHTGYKEKIVPFIYSDYKLLHRYRCVVKAVDKINETFR